jgi:hypothetical protein
MDPKKILAGVVPRAAALVVLGIVLTAGVTWAASRGVPKVAPLPPVKKAAVPTKLVVPDVRKEAFVFAKGTLEDDGFAWRVVGKVHGYASNTVIAQSPAPGTRVYDTGAPLVRLKLSHNAGYGQRGLAEDASPYAPTEVAPVETVDTTPTAAAPTTTVSTTTEATTTTAPAPTAPATTAPTTTTAPQHTAAPPKRAATASTAAWPKTRPPAFVVAGAKTEPLDEMPLTDRAQMLGRWLAAHPKRTTSNVRYWLYQNAWIVTGARFGWWHGADALRTLIAVDRHADAVWGIGTQSADVAGQALSYVQAKSKS